MREDVVLFEVGEVVAGSYEIRSVLGEGGMGRVYGAHDVSLNRRVALKASWPNVDKRLLQKEAQALASVRHPGMLEVYGVGTHRGIAFLVTELLPGRNLASFVEERPGKQLPIDEALDVLIPVADALAAVHRAGIVHRDVKPANIMLTPSGRIVLMDFGLFQPENQGKTELSGTPEYLAPEALQGDVDPRNAFFIDIYALGITAYEVLAGEVPFMGDSPMATIAQHMGLHARDLREVRPSVPPRLAALVHEMLAKDPLERPPSMESVAFRLRAAREASANGPRSAPSPASGKMRAASPSVPRVQVSSSPSWPSATSSRPSATSFGLVRLLARAIGNVMVVMFDREMRLVFAAGGTGGGATLEDVVTPERAGRMKPLYEAALRGESGELGIEEQGRKLLVKVMPVKGESGEITGGMAVVRDAGATEGGPA